MTASTAPTTLLLQLSDLHIREPGRLAYGRLDTAPYLRQAVETVLRMPQRPDAIVATGDLTDFGRPEEYGHLRKLLAPLGAIPLYLLPGNHDDRAQLRASFPGHGYLGTDGFVQFSVSVGGLQLIALDTVVPGASEGSLCAERLEWLAAQLDASRGRPVVIAMHHPPFRTLIGHMDEIGLLEGAQALEALVARHPNVERVICGHLHRSIQVRFGGTIAATVPLAGAPGVPGPRARCRVGLDAGAPGLRRACAARRWAAGEPPGSQRAVSGPLPVPRRRAAHRLTAGAGTAPVPAFAQKTYLPSAASRRSPMACRASPRRCCRLATPSSTWTIRSSGRAFRMRSQDLWRFQSMPRDVPASKASRSCVASSASCAFRA